MNERDLQAEEPFARRGVYELHALAREGRKGCVNIVHLIGDVMHARSAAGEELAHGGVRAGRSEQLDATLADEHGGRLDTLLGNRGSVLQLGAEKPRVRVERLVEIVDGDTYVMDAARMHPSDANEGSTGGEELEAVAEWVKGIKALVPDQLVVPAHVADPAGQ
jgi:hypothetical protein